MMYPLCAIGYFAIGVCCFMYRCYIEPELFRRIGSQWKYDTHTEFYAEARVAALFVWPVWLVLHMLGLIALDLHASGQRRLERADKAAAERRDQEREIDRIIAEHKL